MTKTYNLYNLEAPFKEYLDAGNQKPISIKNYLSDFRHFAGWVMSKGEETSPLQRVQHINADTISEYKSYLESNNIPHKTINRRLSTLRKFCSFCISQGWMKENPAKKISNISRLSSINYHLESDKEASISPIPLSSPWRRGSSRLITFLKSNLRLDSLLRGNDKQQTKDDLLPTNYPLQPNNIGLQQYVAFLIILIFMAVLGAGIYNQFFVKNRQSLAYPTTLTKAGRILSFQGRLTDTLSNPITTATNVVFQLYSVSSGGVALYNTGSCSVTPDQDGIFNSLIGSDCGAEIASSVFSENVSVYLGVTVGADAEMTPRQQIANVGYAINSETLQGLPPGSNVSNIPYINSQGNLLIAASNPNLASTYASSTFTISSAQATTIQSAGTGDIVLQATESGTLKFRTGGTTDANTRITVDNVGLVGIGTTGPDAKLDSLATTEQLRLTYTDGTVYSAHTVDSSGNLTIDNTGTKTIIADDLQVTGGDILDSNGNESIRFGTTASAVNEATLTNAATGGIVTLAATGGDTDVVLSIDSKGADALNLNGTATGDVNLAGGYGGTGCTITNSNGNLSCNGTITGTFAGTLPWSSLIAPTGNLTLAMDADTTTFNWDTLTTGTGWTGASTSLSSGTLESLSVNSTAATGNTQKVLSLSTAGANATSTQTTYGLYATNTHTGTASTNIGGYFSASGGTNNYAAIFENGNVGIGTTAPLQKLHVEGQCVAMGTLIRRRKKKKRGDGDEDEWEDVPVEDIKPGDEVLTLNEESGGFEWQEVEEIMDMGIQEAYELITESGKKIETTGNHPYLTRGFPGVVELDSNSNEGPRNQNQSGGDLSAGNYSHKFIVIHNESLSKTTANNMKNIANKNDFVNRKISTFGIKGVPNNSKIQAAAMFPDIPEAVLNTEGFIFSTLSENNLGVNGVWKKVSYLKVGDKIATLDGFEKITSIKITKRQQMYDLQIANTHNFVGNGIVAHNTYLKGLDQLNTSFALRTADSTGADKFVVTNAGNVGIGTTGPGSLLHVAGATRPTFTLETVGVTSKGRIFQADTTPRIDISENAYYNGSSYQRDDTTQPAAQLVLANGDIYYRTTAAGANPITWTTGLFNANSGNVGIGTTGPDAKLDSLATTEQLRLTYTDGTVYSAHTVDSSGNLTIDNTGTKTVIADDLQINGGDILDSNGNESIRFGTTASAVNEATLTNAATGGIVTLAATGGDTDIALSVDSKGADALNLNGTATGDILLGGGSGSTGCTLTNSTGEFTCTILTASSLKWNALTVPDGNLTLAMDADTTTFNWDTLTTGTGWTGASTSLSSGTLESLSVNSTAATGNTQKVLSLSTAGANATSTQTTYGLYATNTHTGTASTNIGGYFSASGGTNNYAAIFENGNVGIGTTAPGAKLHVYESTALGSTAGNSQLNSRFAGNGTNNFMHNEWLYRDSAGSDWLTARLHDAISVDSSYLTPGTDTRTWWERDPYNNIQSWGNAASTYLTINAGNVGIGTTAPDKKLSVWGGDGSIMDPTDLGTESLTNGALTAGTSWTQTTDCALVTDAATCTFAAGTASTVQQASGTLAVAGVGSRWYKFVYTVSGLTGTPTANITTAFASATTALTLTAGTQTTYFKSATTPTNFVITTTLTAGQAFTLDDLSLKEVQGGDLALGGILTGGGTTGLKVLANGNVGIGTTAPGRILEISKASGADFRLTDSDGVNADAYIEFLDSTTRRGYIGLPGNANEDLVIASENSSDIILSPSGNVGIGTTAPSQQLELTGDLKIGGDDLFMATNTANYFLMADGTNYNPVTPAAARTGLGLDSGGAGDIWVDEAGDSMIGDLTMSGTTANINLGSNYLSGDGGDEGVFVESTGNVGIGMTAPGNMKLRVEGNVRAASYYDTGDLTDTYFLNPAGSSSFGGSLTLVGQLTFNGTLEANANTIQLLSSATTAVCVGDATCTGKIDAGTVDPPYTINGKNYATFLPSMTGVKEETTGIITLNSKNPSTNVYESIIDFAGQPEASDLWLFSKVTDLKKNIDQMTVLLTPSENTRSWYKIDKENVRLYVYSSRPTNISYRLTAPRFDSEKWSNRRADDARTGFIINDQGDVTGPPSSVSYNKPEISPQDFVYDGNTENFKQSNSLYTLTGDFIDEFTSVTEALIARLKVGFIEAENIIVNNTLIAKNIAVDNIQIAGKNINQLIDERISTFFNSRPISPIAETENIIATGTAKLNEIATNEIKPQSGDLTIDLSSPVIPSQEGIQESLDSRLHGNDNGVEKGTLARLIIKGLAGKTAVVIDAGGNASFSGQIIADSLQINNDATVSGNLASSTLTTNDASVSGKLVAGTIESSTINDIQALLADIKNQPIPDPNYYQNLIVTGQSNLYNVSISGSLLVGTTLIDQNSIISLASELKLSALSTINLFDGAVIIAKDGKITTRGEIIAEGGIRTNEIKPLTDDGRVSINNLAINNLTIDNISTNSAVIAASDNFAQNGIFAPAIETATASAGIGILPENSSEVVIYNNTIKENSLIYLTPTSTSTSVSQLTVGEKSIGTKSYFKVISNTPSTLPTKFNWLIVN